MPNVVWPYHFMSSGLFTFQQEGFPAHGTRGTAVLLQEQTPDFTASELWPPINSPGLNRDDYIFIIKH